MKKNKIIIIILSSLLCVIFINIQIEGTDGIKIHKNKHLLITDDIDNQLGYVPEVAASYSLKETQERYLIEGDKNSTYALVGQNDWVDFTLLLDNNRKRDIKYRILVHDESNFALIDSSKKKTKNYKEFIIPENSSAEIPLKVKIDPSVEMSSLNVVLLEMNERNRINNNVIRVLWTRKDVFVKEEFLFESPKVENVKYINTNDQEGFITFLDSNLNKSNIRDSEYIKIKSNKLEDIVRTLVIFDSDGSLYDINGKNKITVNNPKGKSAILPIPKELKKEQDLYLLSIQNPYGLSFKNIRELLSGQINTYTSYSEFYPLQEE